MKLFSCQNENNQMGIGIETDDGNFDLTTALDIFQKSKNIPNAMPFSFLQVLVELGYCSKEMIDQILESPWVQAKMESLRLPDNLRFDVPISRPSKIVCLGRNYVAHAKELDHNVPEEPVLFCKSPSTLLPHQGEILIPSWLDSRVDHEAELGIVIGKQGKDIPEEKAMDYVAGYTIVNDVTARSIQKEDLAKSDPWFRSKSIDTFCPMGPYIVPADAMPDPQNVDIQLTVNGKTKQQASTSDMIFKIPEIISNISKFMTLEPADVIATGTPEGVSPIQDGDEIEITITGLGTLKNKVRKL